MPVSKGAGSFSMSASLNATDVFVRGSETLILCCESDLIRGVPPLLSHAPSVKMRWRIKHFCMSDLGMRAWRLFAFAFFGCRVGSGPSLQVDMSCLGRVTHDSMTFIPLKSLRAS